MKKLVVYYSYTGNTESLVERIKEKIDCDVVKILPKVEYSTDYQAVVDQAKKDVENNAMPEIQDLKVDLSLYDTIILGSPVWWYTFAPVINTFLNNNDLANKTIIPFITNAGWLGHTIPDMEKLCPNANVIDALSVKFDEDNLLEEEKFNNWLERIK